MNNGQNYDWESTQISLPHGTLVGIEKIEYSDEKDIKEVYGKGSKPRSYGAGNYKAEGKLTLLREEFNDLVAYMKKQGVTAFYKLPPFPITASYANDDRPIVTDRLHDCKFKKTSLGIDQGAEKSEVELEFLILGGIDWNGLPGDVNA